MPAEANGRPLHLVAMAGLSPQVVTETIWCLAHRDPPELPERITVMTTAAGQALAEDLLLPALRELSAALGTRLPLAQIRPLLGPDGVPLTDIASDADNRVAADAILAVVAEATLDPGYDVHLSIAGGRKTMGCLAASALSLYGRDGDALSHVLVDARLQGRTDFFFPPPEPVTLALPGGGSVNTAEHGLTLANVPFVRLRAQWRPGRDASPFAVAVSAVQEALAPPTLLLDVASRRARLGKFDHVLPPVLFGILLWFAERVLSDAPPLRWRGEAEAKAVAASCLAAIARASSGRDQGSVRRALSSGLERTYLAEKVSRLNRVFREVLGPAAEPFLICAEGTRPQVAYRLNLPPEAITIIEDARGR